MTILDSFSVLGAPPRENGSSAARGTAESLVTVEEKELAVVAKEAEMLHTMLADAQAAVESWKRRAEMLEELHARGGQNGEAKAEYGALPADGAWF